MFKTVSTILKSRNYLKTNILRLSTQFDSFRTNDSDPTKHTVEHLGRFYKVPQNERNLLYITGGLPKTFDIQTQTFQETCLMIRKPSIDIINCIKSIDFAKPPIKFVLYGMKGSGKSLSLIHIIHYCHKNDFLIVHVPWVGNWMRRCRESSNSETEDGYIDLNVDAAAWLFHFKNQNEQFLKKTNLRTTQDHVWSKREQTPKDSPLIELIDFGLNRIKYASNCVVALADEIKNLSNLDQCKTLVAIDGFNAFFYPKPRIFNDKKELVHPKFVTLTKAFFNLTKTDWKNSVIVVTVDEIAIGADDQKSHLPRYLLGKDGFDHLDPFVPISVDNYDKKELTSCLDYYRERRWIVPKTGQDEELAFISASNPYKLMQVCKSL